MDVVFILVLMIMLHRRLKNSDAPAIMDFLACFAPALIIYVIPKFLVMLLWYRGHLTWPIQSDPIVHGVAGTVSFIFWCVVFKWRLKRTA
jgi:hypothetical protein